MRIIKGNFKFIKITKSYLLNFYHSIYHLPSSLDFSMKNFKILLSYPFFIILTLSN